MILKIVTMCPNYSLALSVVNKTRALESSYMYMPAQTDWDADHFYFDCTFDRFSIQHKKCIKIPTHR